MTQICTMSPKQLAESLRPVLVFRTNPQWLAVRPVVISRTRRRRLSLKVHDRCSISWPAFKVSRKRSNLETRRIWPVRLPRVALPLIILQNLHIYGINSNKVFHWLCPLSRRIFAVLLLLPYPRFTTNSLSFESEKTLPPLQSSTFIVRRELRLINEHLHRFDRKRVDNEHRGRWVVWQKLLFSSVNTRADIHYAKKFDAKTNELLLHNERLTSQSHQLQDRLDQLEKKNLRLIRRLTEQVNIFLVGNRTALFICRIFVCCPRVKGGSLRRIVFFFAKKSSFSKRNSIMSTMISPLCSPEIVRSAPPSTSRNDRSLATRNYSSRQRSPSDARVFSLSSRRDLKQSAEVLLGEFNHPSIDEKVKHFLSTLLREQQTR